MRLAVAAVLLLLSWGSLALAAPGDRATATFSGTTLTLTLHYWMTCGRPGPGPVTVNLPSGVRVTSLRASVNGKPAAVSHSGGRVAVTLAKPAGVTCMSIALGTLRVALAGLHANGGTYALTAQVNRHSFRTSFSVA